VQRRSLKTQAFLAGVPLFGELAPAELDALAAGTTELQVPRGEVVVNRGDPCAGFHVVVYGQVKLSFVSRDGGEKVLEIIGPGGSFGEAVMFMDKPYVVTAQALADSLLLHVSKEVVGAGLERDPKFARKMLAGMARRLHALIADVEAYSLQSGTQRVIGYLLRQDAHPADDVEPCVVTLPTSKAIVASRLNLTPEHFSRILHELADAGLIDVLGRDVRIIDIARLRSHGA
jgi:CRP-like cAMP-binding protein